MSAFKNAGFSLIEVLVTILILMVGLLGLAGLQSRALTAQMEAYQRSQALILLKDMADRINANRNVASCYAVSTPSDTSLGTGTAVASIATVAYCIGIATVAAADVSSGTTSYCTAAGGCTNACFLPSGALATCPTDAVAMAAANASATARVIQGTPIALSDLQEWHDLLLGAAETMGGADVGAMIGARGCVYRIAAPAHGAPAQYLVAVAWQGLNSTAVPGVDCGKDQYDDETKRRVVTLPISIADLN